MSADDVRVRVVVQGRVQGVWYRDSCQREARRLGISGWVRNNHDGAVEGEFEGPAAAVDRLVEWCRTGPPRARVDNVDVERIAAIGAGGFRIR